MKRSLVQRIEQYLDTWTTQDVERLDKGAAHGDEEHLRFALILLRESSKKLEKLTIALIGLTILLAFLTVVLIRQTLYP